MKWTALLAVLLTLGCQSETKIRHVEPVPAPIAAADTGTVAVIKASSVAELPDTGHAVEKDRATLCPEAEPGMACIPGGWFTRGVDTDTHQCEQEEPLNQPLATRPAMKVWVDTFMMDIYEVSVAEYLACMHAGDCPKAGPVYADYKNPKQPITGVSWFDAQAYCAAHQKRLPTETEWELAARGHDGEANPWGDAPADCELAVIMDDKGRSCGQIKRRGKSPEKGRVLFVDSRPPQRFGLVNMVGNAEEWVADWWSPGWDACGEACAGKNPKGPCAGAETCDKTPFKVVRGGSWYWDASHATGFHRRKNYPANVRPFHHFGFRCARDLK